jgi:flavin-dependent dehydrogenase
MLAAEATFKALVEGSSMELYWENLKKSWIWEELHKARNYRPVCVIYIDIPKHVATKKKRKLLLNIVKH